MRNLRLTLAGLVTLATIGTVSLSTGVSANASSLPTLASCKTSINADEYTKGKLTVATDTPAYTPWFVNNTPSNGKGYESGVAYAIAKELGVKKSKVVWVHEPFNASFAPGIKKFDFDINEISYTSARAKVVTFSSSYYNVQQSIIALKGSKIVKDHTPAELKTYQYGDQIGTTGLLYIDQQIKPTKSPRIYNSLAPPPPPWKRARSTPSSWTRPTDSTWRRPEQVKSSTQRARRSRSRSGNSRARASTMASCFKRVTSSSVA